MYYHQNSWSYYIGSSLTNSQKWPLILVILTLMSPLKSMLREFLSFCFFGLFAYGVASTNYLPPAKALLSIFISNVTSFPAPPLNFLFASPTSISCYTYLSVPPRDMFRLSQASLALSSKLCPSWLLIPKLVYPSYSNTTRVFEPFNITDLTTVFYAFTFCKRMNLRTLLSHKLKFYSQSDYFPSVSLTLHSCYINRTSLLLLPPHHFLLLIVYSTVGSAWHIS